MGEIEKLIDIESLIRQSNNKFLRNLPSWAVRLVKNTIREQQLNEIYNKYKHLEGIDFLRAVLYDELQVKVNFMGGEGLDPNKNYVYAANHPLGGIDAMAHFDLVFRNHGRGVSPSNELFEYIPTLHSLIIGVNVFGRNAKAKARELNELFASDMPVMIFPSGEVSRLINFKIRDPRWKKTFVTKAVQYQRDIVPSFISGRNSFWFYFIAKLRKLSGIKLYIETMLLPREMLKQYGYEITIYTLKPISWQEIKQSGKSDQWWADEIYRRVYEAGKQLKKLKK